MGFDAGAAFNRVDEHHIIPIFDPTSCVLVKSTSSIAYSIRLPVTEIACFLRIKNFHDFQLYVVL